MPRLHLKRVAAVSATLLIFCVCVIVLLHHRMSRQYYRDVDPELWKLLAHDKTTRSPKPTTKRTPHIHVKQIPSLSLNVNWTIRLVEDTFFKYLENKDIRCENDMRLGNWNEGGWNVCLSPPYKFMPSCVVFSFGNAGRTLHKSPKNEGVIGYDWQFDDSIANQYNCRVLAFDPSMQEPDSRRSPLIEFRKIGLGARNEVNEKGWKMKTLRQHLLDEGYWGVPVDYLKIDIEYMEWEVLKQAFTDESLKYVKQLGFEMHTPEMFRIFKHLGRNVSDHDPDEEKLDFIHMFETLHKIEIFGFKKFNYRKNPFGNYKSNYTKKERSCCYELHYINTDFLNDNDTIKYTKDSKIFHR